uniref:Uncharacterized protein n=1 Tax=viral metagenome TaxID=1070528 RepID=A0A6M3IRJ5_9ZZZZ
MNAGIDIGYKATKIATSSQHKMFQSIVGTLDESSFKTSGVEATSLVIGDSAYFIGRAADEQSRFASRGQETRNWIETTDYDVLIKASLGWLHEQYPDEDEYTVVTGLPVSYFRRDAEKLKAKFLGAHSAVYNGEEYHVSVVNARVIPQPFGTLFSYVFDRNGVVNEKHAKLAMTKVGVLDIGSHTTNMQVIIRGDDLAKESTSIAVGGWKLVQAVKERLGELMPELEPSDHAVAAALEGERLMYYGEEIDIRSVAAPFASDIANSIKAQVAATWGTAADLYAILVTGGGAHLIGEYLKFPQSWIVPDPVFANVQGYSNFAQRVARMGQ